MVVIVTGRYYDSADRLLVAFYGSTTSGTVGLLVRLRPQPSLIKDGGLSVKSHYELLLAAS